MEKRLSDLDYCYASWKLVTDLEKLSYARNQSTRDFEERVSKRKSFVSGLLAIIAPLILWGYVLLFSGKNIIFGTAIDFGVLSTRLIGLFTVSIFLFLIVFMGLRALWAKNAMAFLRRIVEKKYKARLTVEVREIDENAWDIVNNRAFVESGIPESFFSIEILPLLIRYFESGQAMTMKEALYCLKLEFQNTDHYTNRLLNENLFQREKKYLVKTFGETRKHSGENGEDSDKKNQESKEEAAEEKEELQNQNIAQSFVQDDFFKKGHWGLKIRQISINLVFLAILVLPIMILFNSLADGSIWKNLYSWTYQDGFDLSSYLQSSILFAGVLVLVCSLAFLFRNNYREEKVYRKMKTYDEEKLEARKKFLDEMYTARFGEQEFRETTKYYVVEGKQNLPDHLISDLFKKNGVEIK